MTTKPVYYFAETTSLYSLREAEPLKASSLTSAKREARRKALYEGTWVTIGTSVNSDGFLSSCWNYVDLNEVLKLIKAYK